MVNKNVILRRMRAIDEHLMKIEKYSKMTQAKFQHDVMAQDIVEYNFFQIINHLSDMLEHIVVDEGMGYPQSAQDAGEILAAKKILTKADVVTFRKMVGFRNVIAHDYLDIDKKIVYALLVKGGKDVRRLVRKVVYKFS